MVYVLLTAVILLLAASGILTYKNSKLLANRIEDRTEPHSSALTYSVYSQPISDERSDAVQLFHLTILSQDHDIHSTENAGNSLILCRMAEGEGEMVQADALRWMLTHIREAASRNVTFQHKAFLEKACGNEEMELLKKLIQAATEEAS